MATRTIDTATRVDPTARLVSVYSKLLTQIVSRVEGGRLRSDAYLAQQVPSILQALDRLDRDVAAWARESIPPAYRLSAGAAQTTISQAGLPVLTSRFGDFDRRAARALVARTSANLGRISSSLVEGLVGGERPDSGMAVRRMRAALAGENATVALANGELAVRTPAGRFWRAEPYARMLGRTATADARRVAFRSRYLQNGVDVVVVVPNGTDHDVCAAWEGERLSLTGATEGLPTPEDARADGLWHPNCRHRYVVDDVAEQPGRDLTSPAGPNFSTLGRPQSATAAPRRAA